MVTTEILVKYEDMLGDGEKIIERFTYTFQRMTFLGFLCSNIRKRVVKELFQRGVIVKELKELEMIIEFD